MVRQLKKYLFAHKNILGINARNLKGIYPHNHRHNFPNVDDKLRCKAMLSASGIPVPRTLHIIASPADMAMWPEIVGNVGGFAIKPNNSYGGNGIALVKRRFSEYLSGGETISAEDINFHVLHILNGAFSRDNVRDSCFFEQLIDSTGVLDALHPPHIGGVPDIRIIFLNETPLMAMMRLPTLMSEGRANLHQGGIGVGIDLQTGTTRQGCQWNTIIEKHPDTAEPLAGIEVPCFNEMLSMGAHISKIVGLGYIGIDIVIDCIDGPLILEVNARPGLNIQLANQMGMKGHLI